MPTAEPSATEAKSTFSAVVQRPVAVIMVTVAVFVFGLISYSKLPITLLPDVSYPTLTVRTSYPGAAPHEVETEIAIRLEERLSTLPGLRHMTSVSRAERADINLEFRWGTDVDVALQTIAENIDRVRLKEGIEKPLILRYDPTLEPVAQVGLFGDAPLTDLWVYADEVVRRRLEAIEGVASARPRGGLEPQIHVEVDTGAMTLRGLDMLKLGERLRSANVNAPGGRIKDGQTDYFLRANNAFRSLTELNQLPILPDLQQDLRLSDIAQVTVNHSDEKVITRVDGKPAVVIEVYREADSNIVAVAQRIRARLKRGIQTPERMKVVLLQDRATFIEEAIAQVKSTAIQGAGLSVLILFFFLRRFLPTLVMALSIPLSVMATFIPLFARDISLNLMTLGGLALGIGMLVDNSIVVLESISRCHQEDELSPLEAAVKGTREVAQAVVASTLTTLAVFFPIVFVEGIAGQLFGDLSLVIVFSLVASLLVSLTVVPALAPRLLAVEMRHEASKFTWFPLAKPQLSPYWEEVRKRREAVQNKSGAGRLLAAAQWPVFLVLWFLASMFGLLSQIFLPLLGNIAVLSFGIIGWFAAQGARFFMALSEPALKVFHSALDTLKNVYGLQLKKIQNRPWVYCLFVVALTAAVFFNARNLAVSLIPNMSQGTLQVALRFPVGTPLAQTVAKSEQFLNEVREAIPDLQTVLAAGVDPEDEKLDDVGEHIAQIDLKLPRDAQQNFGTAERALEKELRALSSTLPDAQMDVSYPSLLSVKKPVSVHVKAHDTFLLENLNRDVLANLKLLEGLKDLRSSQQPGYPEYQVKYNRERLLTLPYSAPQVARILKAHLLGEAVGTFPLDGRLVDIRLLPRNRLSFDLEDVKQKPLFTHQNQLITLGHLAEVNLGKGPMEIRRIDGKRSAEITANYTGFNLGGLNQNIRVQLDRIPAPVGTQMELGGQAEEMDRSLASLGYALLLSVFLVYVVMAAQFESLRQPLLIMSVVPLALAGALLGLMLADVSLSVMALLGMIVLVGIVVNNAIVLVDTANQRAQTRPWNQAVQEAALMRFRPILITALTTILGLLPMTVFGGAGAEVRLPLALTVIAGLTWATFLTLGVIPALLFVFHPKPSALRPEQVDPS